MRWASVVLPRPGGPQNSTWSRASPRRLAASTKIFRLSSDLVLPDVLVEVARAQRGVEGVLMGGAAGQKVTGPTANELVFGDILGDIS